MAVKAFSNHKKANSSKVGIGFILTHSIGVTGKKQYLPTVFSSWWFMPQIFWNNAVFLNMIFWSLTELEVGTISDRLRPCRNKLVVYQKWCVKYESSAKWVLTAILSEISPDIPFVNISDGIKKVYQEIMSQFVYGFVYGLKITIFVPICHIFKV